MNSVSRALASKITEKRRTLKSGKTVVYHQLQQWFVAFNFAIQIFYGNSVDTPDTI
jgi:hypothetical protein